MHTGIYCSRPEVGGIVDTHAPYSPALACLGGRYRRSMAALCYRTRVAGAAHAGADL
ncbi:class II aldolase/adducin family protein [Rubrobacter taiwanensis]|uniref:class II aldolase/adducin family protein n=1 Tax=Rubrobacter taiwanensis TaxID=185139 RepID=UPI0014049D96|nr:class II aldolase/adducin family protein [Rubrobacter taiwanensis]